MEIEAWLALAAAHALGAISPGPSLALVLSNTLNGGARPGIMSGLGHGIGFGLYSLLAASGLASALSAHASVEKALQWGGMCILLYLGIKTLRHASTGPYTFSTADTAGIAPSLRTSFAQGFALAIFNPKILAWMLAIYAPFVHADLGATTVAGMVALGTLIDGGWYVAVATVLSRSGWIPRLRAVAHRLDAAMGVFMLVLAAIVLARAI